jgi:hypothetical protein
MYENAVYAELAVVEATKMIELITDNFAGKMYKMNIISLYLM